MSYEYGLEPTSLDNDLVRRRDVREAFAKLTKFSNVECRDVINSVVTPKCACAPDGPFCGACAHDEDGELIEAMTHEPAHWTNPDYLSNGNGRELE